MGQISDSDPQLAPLFELEHRRLAKEAVKTFQLPETSQRCLTSKEDAQRMARFAVSQDWDNLVPSMVQMLGKLTNVSTLKAVQSSPKRAVKKSPKQTTPASSRDEARVKLFQESPAVDEEAESEASEEEPEERETCCRCCGRCLMMVLAAIVGIWISAWVLENCRRAGLLPVPISMQPPEQ